MNSKTVCRSNIIVHTVTDHDCVLRSAIRLFQSPFKNRRIGFCHTEFCGRSNHFKKMMQIPVFQTLLRAVVLIGNHTEFIPTSPQLCQGRHSVRIGNLILAMPRRFGQSRAKYSIAERSPFLPSRIISRRFSRYASSVTSVPEIISLILRVSAAVSSTNVEPRSKKTQLTFNCIPFIFTNPDLSSFFVIDYSIK